MREEILLGGTNCNRTDCARYISCPIASPLTANGEFKPELEIRKEYSRAQIVCKSYEAKPKSNPQKP